MLAFFILRDLPTIARMTSVHRQLWTPGFMPSVILAFLLPVSLKGL
ncbi:hypothetical protein ANACOL_00989 [Anaerotruncus colihominis DSM 17241]|uniref:Uncharacterized protein n=1 Tax=Anaerotruncus colihominis DSM 17241 TaxID=445972 RepID=B0P8A0_9FIRM|nr:hypothetical protein ANACOL_00989 [Anaerotruncus colihominis DSM 17241]